MSHAEALERAGIPLVQHSAVLSALEKIFGRYEHRVQQPKNAVKTLGRVVATTTKLRDLIAQLPDDVRFCLDLVTDAEEDDMLGKLIERARLAQAAMRKPVGRQRDALDGLLNDLVELWRREMPDGTWIQQAMDADEGYSGPLFDFAKELLNAEEIKFTSVKMLGRRLTALV